MHQRRWRALIAAFALAALPAGVLAQRLDHIGTYVWRVPGDRDFGGFSGVALSADGSAFHAVTDRAHLYWGTVQRDGNGRITGLSITGRSHLTDSRGNPLPPGRLGDSEGIAIASDGTIWISFEGLDRIAAYATPQSRASRIPPPRALADLRINSGMEALAITSDGAIIAIPERSGHPDQPFPVLRWQNDIWDVPFTIPRRGRFLPTGADIGPDGRLYLLERDFRGLLGFSSRIRRFNLDGTGEQVLLETRPLQYDNLEGISVWDDGTGLRLTLISDDNFNILQRTEIVEYRLTE
ncbi:MAG: esterase-like activity of phytase family protein [Paracoccus sp. (in: a-proteobacteria)]|uniref:esterase-like activity of phytase family protein n=1 Tax=Paracoccus sp. TaxID=267 RepID=UPI0026DFEB0D|nr:esterase-like activity of phytase family protein [Paracoccus sp. (in: a-proteobacteria)]MDO5631929.1 esterase-like activity of phytase family protein [Paracoccus sp. (in: a-proteobacteria)]